MRAPHCLTKVPICCGWRIIALLAALALVPLGAAQAATGRAVSLNALATACKSGQGASVARLCGITEVRGFLVDDASGDVIVIGKVDPALPALQLDDFAVALRNVWGVYAKTRGRVRYYSAPGCSIDPDPNVIQELQNIGDRMRAGGPGNRMEDIEADWSRAGRSPQNVRVMGVPFDSRFAKVMVDADYYMKRLVNGTVQLDIPGFVSLSDLKADEAREELKRGGKFTDPGQSLNRFWFSPGETTYEEDGGVVSLRSCRVTLLTEAEFLTSHGQIAGMGRPDPLAGKFAHSFGAYYDDIAHERPIYNELQGLFRFVALARMMKDNGARCKGLVYLLKSHHVGISPVSRQVLGLTNVNRVTEERETADGKASLVIVMQSCGGVSMDVRPKKIAPPCRPTPAKIVTTGKRPSTVAVSKPAPAPVRRQTTLKRTVLTARKSPKTVAWDFPLDK